MSHPPQRVNHAQAHRANAGQQAAGRADDQSKS
jgi:hypothetical protein